MKKHKERKSKEKGKLMQQFIVDISAYLNGLRAATPPPSPLPQFFQRTIPPSLLLPLYKEMGGGGGEGGKRGGGGRDEKKGL